MTLRQQVTDVLILMPGSQVLLDIHGGHMVPPFTDYYLRPVSDDWAAPPPELVDGLRLLPVFTNDDCFSIYCIEETRGRFYQIDPEQPWPVTNVFASCDEFLMHFLRIVQENCSEEVSNRLLEQVEYLALSHFGNEAIPPPSKD